MGKEQKTYKVKYNDFGIAYTYANSISQAVEKIEYWFAKEHEDSDITIREVVEIHAKIVL